MSIAELKAKLNTGADRQKALEMSRYMRGQFPFLGIPREPLRKLAKDWVKAQDKSVDWEVVNALWREDYREYQYIALDYLKARKKHFKAEDLDAFYKLITHKSWWDTVDELAKDVGRLVKKNKELKDDMVAWSLERPLWVRRVAIIHQLGFKKKTDTDLLARIILNNTESEAFFINKAIGWALRDYSKTDPDWVMAFLKKNQSRLSTLSIREAGKYLPDWEG